LKHFEKTFFIENICEYHRRTVLDRKKVAFGQTLPWTLKKYAWV